MATFAPSLARRKAMPRPIRLAEPVTRMTRSSRESIVSPFYTAGLYRRLAMDFDLFRIHARERRFRQPPSEIGPAPEHRGQGAENATPRSNHARAGVVRSKPCNRHGNHHGHPGPGFDGGEDASAIIVCHMPQELRCIEYRAHGNSSAGKTNKKQSRTELRSLAEQYVRHAVNHVRDRDQALVRFKSDLASESICKQRAADQAETRTAPNDADARRAAMKNLLAKQAEEDLSRAATGGPSHGDQAYPEDQG